MNLIIKAFEASFHQLYLHATLAILDNFLHLIYRYNVLFITFTEVPRVISAMQPQNTASEHYQQDPEDPSYNGVDGGKGK
jgi:hypothetical protein